MQTFQQIAPATRTMPAVAAPPDRRLTALRRFALSITVLNILGQLFLGFEMSYAQPFIALLTAYSIELGLEVLDARLRQRPLAFAGGGFQRLVDFLLPAHITALAVAMLLYCGETFTPVIFAVAVGVGAKYIFRAPLGKGRWGHFLNPSNTGIVVTLLLFHWVGVAPPYEFTENVSGIWDWAIPGVILVTGSLLNGKLTGRMPLILAWVGGFLLQALVRGAFLDFSLLHALSPVTGVAFVLFTFYMVTDPGTTPSRSRSQVAFGLSVALVYGLLDVANVVYQIFFALSIVCVARGCLLYASAWWASRAVPAPARERLAPERAPVPELVAGATSRS